MWASKWISRRFAIKQTCTTTSPPPAHIPPASPHQPEHHQRARSRHLSPIGPSLKCVSGVEWLLPSTRTPQQRTIQARPTEPKRRTKWEKLANWKINIKPSRPHFVRYLKIQKNENLAEMKISPRFSDFSLNIKRPLKSSSPPPHKAQPTGIGRPPTPPLSARCERRCRLASATQVSYLRPIAFASTGDRSSVHKVQGNSYFPRQTGSNSLPMLVLRLLRLSSHRGREAARPRDPPCPISRL